MPLRRGNSHGGRGHPGSQKRAKTDTAGPADRNSHKNKPGKKGNDYNSPPNSSATGQGSSYAQAAAEPPQHAPTSTPHTHFSASRDPPIPQPFHTPAHLLVTGVYSGNASSDSELLFRQFFPPGEAATREQLLDNRSFLAAEVFRQFGIKIPPAKDGDDSITIVTRRDPSQTSLWRTTGDVRIKFSPEQARVVYHQQRNTRKLNLVTNPSHTYVDIES